jgi:SAM-dependent methyltransferase
MMMPQSDNKRVLNAGSGGPDSGALHPAFRSNLWEEVRLDIDASERPDIIGSFSQMRGVVADSSFDAIWSSHSLEHLHTHQVIPALREFRRILKGDGFALVTCPDLKAIATLMLNSHSEAVAYQSTLGPIRVLDMIYGHARSIAEGRTSMAHNTGFTVERLGRVAIEAGFAEVRVMEGSAFDLWAALMMPEADERVLAAHFRNTKVEELFVGGDQGKAQNIFRPT